jgi:hypothetical protein
VNERQQGSVEEGMTSILWRRLDSPGHEAARIDRAGARWKLHGSAVFLEEGAVSLHYEIDCTPDWRTLGATVSGFVGERLIDVSIRTDGGSWSLNGERIDAVEGCIDLDLNFSPSTNLLPIRRLELSIGGRADVRAAWLRFPSFRLEVLEQSYERVAEQQYRYRSRTGFEAELDVDAVGFVRRYGSYWKNVEL